MEIVASCSCAIASILVQVVNCCAVLSVLCVLQPFLYVGARCGCIAWSTSRLNRPLLAVGSDDPKMKNEQRIVFYEFHENIRSETFLFLYF